MNGGRALARPSTSTTVPADARGTIDTRRVFAYGPVAWAQAFRLPGRNLATPRNTSWHAERVVAQPRAATRVVVGALSALINAGLFWALADRFTADGLLWSELAQAERACSHHEYVSQRQACIRTYMAEVDRRTIARR